MCSLAEKFDYLEKLTRKVSRPPNQEPKKRAYVPFQGKTDGDSNPAKKKKKNKQKQTKGGNQNTNGRKSTIEIAQKPPQKATRAAVQNDARDKIQHGAEEKMQQKTKDSKSEEFIAVDILRKRLHQKIEESRGQGPLKDPTSEEVLKRREKRKQERERKKRKRKEFRMKKLAESSDIKIKEEETEQAPEPQPDKATEHKKDTSSIVFNKVEVGEEYMDKATKLKEKKRRIKGALTPLTGRNFKQLLSRVEARKARLEELREKDEKKAKKEEEKMRWTNVLYKAEGLKIKDNEDLLRASLKRKEKMKAQRKKKWAQRSQQVLEKMQHRQDKRRKNIQRSKQGKTENRKQKARKKGRVLPEDLKKVAL